MSKGTKIVAGSVIGISLVGLLSIFAVALSGDDKMVYPTPELRSAFLDTYNPDSVIKPFMSPRWIGSLGNSDVPEGGSGTATFKKTFEARFAMQSHDRQRLANALRDQIVVELKASGVTFEQHGNDAEGFKFRYVEGKSAGSITLKPVQQLDEDHLGGPNGSGPSKLSLQFLQPGEIPVQVGVAVDETRTK